MTSDRPRDMFPDVFNRDIKDHTMSVVYLADDVSTYRHLRFARPNTRCYSFDLITWPGHLVYTGDMGTYVFSRVEDMFDFFRGDRPNFNYWAEKCLAQDKPDGITQWSNEKLTQYLKESYDEYLSQFEEGCLSDQDKSELWQEIEDQIINEASNGPTAAIQAAMDFDMPEYPDLRFSDAWEWNCNDYTFRFCWCCHALVWAIARYDEWRALNPKAGSVIADSRQEP